MNTESRAYQVFRFLEEVTGNNIEEKIENPPSVRKGTFKTFYDERRLFTIFKYLSSGDEKAAHTEAISFLKELFSDISLSDDPSEMKETASIIVKAANFIKEYNDFFTRDFEIFKTELFGIPFINTDEIIDDNAKLIDRRFKSKIQQTINEQTCVKTYKFSGTSALEESQIIVSNTILITSDITSINTLKKDDNIRCYVICKIEEPIEYTYFLFVVTYRDSIWITTDQTEFANPRTKQTRRNPSRHREHLWDNVYLPYDIIDDVTKWRKESGTLMKGDEKEFYTRDITTYLPFVAKISLWYFIHSSISYILNNSDIPRIGLVQDFNQKLLEGHITVDESTFTNINAELCQKRVDELILPTSTEIVLASQIQEVSKYVEPNWLCTPENYTNLVAWSEKESLREQKQKALFEYWESHRKEDADKLSKLFQERYEHLLPILFSGKDVYIYIMDADPTSSFGDKGRTFIPKIFTTNECNNNWAEFDIEFLPKKSNWYKYCRNCGRYKTSTYFLKVHSYAEIMALLRCERTYLPQNYINYKSFLYLPYYGNSILDNVNPEYLIKDPLSSKMSNSYPIGICLCKRCIAKLYKKYFRYTKSLVLFNENKLVDIVDYESYIKENNLNIVTTW